MSKANNVLDKAKSVMSSVDESATVDGETVKVGDSVGFKSDVEQGGIITKIKGSGTRAVLTLKATSSEGFRGDHIGGSMTTTETADRCWID